MCRLLAFLVCLLFLALPVCAVGDCPPGCEYCSADPVFVQRDYRDLEGLARVRQARKEGVKVEPKVEVPIVVTK